MAIRELGARARRLAARFRRDRRGGTAVQAIVMLPVIIVAFMGLIRLWQFIQIRDSLHTGTYQATRYLSLYPPEAPNDPALWANIARLFIERNMKNNPWVDPATLNEVNLAITVDLREGYDCKQQFDVKASYSLSVLSGDLSGQGLPNPMIVTMDDMRTGEILCQ